MVSSGAVVAVVNCLKSVAAGDGGDVFKFNAESQLVYLHDGRCVVLANGDAAAGGSFVLQDCGDAAITNDGRSSFELTAGGQLKLKHLGNYCMKLSRSGVHVQNCGSGEEVPSASTVFLAAVSEVDVGIAAQAAEAAALLSAAAARQNALMERLQAALPRVSNCKFALGGNFSFTRGHAMLQRWNGGSGGSNPSEPAAKAIHLIYGTLGVDMEGINQLISGSASLLGVAGAKIAHVA
jgi:hypothetical protein